MKRSKVPLENMHDIVATCIFLYNSRIVNNEWIEDKWIVEARFKLAGRASKEKPRESSELWGEKTKHVTMKIMILTRNNVLIAAEVNDVETCIFL